MKILLSGLNGHMGAEVKNLLVKDSSDMTLVCGVDALNQDSSVVPCAASFDEARTDVDCIIDFSHHSMTAPLLAFAVKNGIPLVLATTGQTEEETEAIKAASKKIPVFFAANYSLGITLLIELAKKTAAVMKDAEIEIIEAHHDRKLDAPSGTALAIADGIRQVRPEAVNNCGRSGQGRRTPEEIGIHAVRMGNIAGMHEVIIGTQNQTITLKHEAHSRAIFAEGAIAAARFLNGRPAGLYNMNSMIEG